MPIVPLRRFLPPIIAAMIVAGIYSAASWSNQFVYDDHEVIENQFPIRHLNDLGRIFREPHYLNFPYYRPLTRTTFALQRSVWGKNPRAYHLFNAILAGAVMLSAYGLLRRPGFGINRPAGLIAASWWALHPAISECVYPAASGRETLLPALLILLATWAYLRRGIGWFWLAMFLFVAALLCKEQAAVLPGIFLLADTLGLRRWRREPPRSGGLTERRERPTWIWRYLPMAGIFAVYFVVRRLIFGQSMLHLTIVQHPWEPLKSLMYGLQTGVTPYMTLRYEPPFENWFDWRLSAVSCAAALGLVGMAMWKGRGGLPIEREKAGGDDSRISIGNWQMTIGNSSRRAALFWVGWFVLLQLPTAHVVEQEAAYSERYAALAILALPAIAAAVLSNGVWPRLRPVIVGTALFWIALLGCLSFLRGAVYSNDESFCIQWQNTSPNAAGPHDGFGRLAQQRQQWSTAIEEYQKALSIQGDDATAHNNLANLLADTGDFAGASREYEWLLSHNSVGADPVATLTNYAQLLGQEAVDRHDPAMRDRAQGLLEEAIALRPDYAQAHYILGLWHIAFGSRDAAIRQFKIALNLRPDWKEVEQELQELQTSPAASEASIPSTRR